jgi:rhamnose utilization protein RhaD (predicted bifunctional aldolase and dehydrogenase)
MKDDVMTPLAPAMLDALRRVSARLGADPALVQGGGGNTSCKADGVLWIKASGRWLVNAIRETMFVPLDLAALRRGIDADDDGAAARAALPMADAEGLRPSIETSLHALLPHAVVVHVHAVAALAWLATRTDDAVYAHRLQGLRWLRLPYERPGLPLTQLVRRSLERQPADVLLLDSHGVVVGADTPEDAEALLLEVTSRLETLPPSSDAGLGGSPCPSSAETDDVVADRDAQAALARLSYGTAYAPATEPAWHALARHPRQRAFASAGAPWPDHVVFLGGGLPVVKRDDAAAVAASTAPVLLVEGVGLLVHRSLDRGGLAMLQCLADVAARVAARPDAVPVYLPAAEVEALSQWDAEKFRREQNRS